MSKYPINKTNNRNLRKNDNKNSTMMPIVQPNSMFSNGSPVGIFTTGKTGDRNFMGRVVRKVYMKNANGDTIVMTDTHDFINVSKGTSAYMNQGRGRNNKRHKP